MRYTIAAILLVDGAILAWAWLTMRDDFAMVVYALLCVSFFGAAPVVLGVLTRRRRERDIASGRKRDTRRGHAPVGTGEHHQSHAHQPGA